MRLNNRKKRSKREGGRRRRDSSSGTAALKGWHPACTERIASSFPGWRLLYCNE